VGRTDGLPRFAPQDHVVTIDRYNERIRYKLWFDDEVRTFLTDQCSQDKTARARFAKQVRTSEKNTYGRIPFAFVHYRAPVRQLWTLGLGTFLRKAEQALAKHRLDFRLSELRRLTLSQVGQHQTVWMCNELRHPLRFVASCVAL
jgi:hypothetical protein